MNKWFPILVLMFALDARAGHEIGNGGDVIRCNPNDDFVSLDYMLTKDLFGDQVKIVRVESLQASLRRISGLIARKLPSLSSSFSMYISDLNNESDFSQTYLWEPVYDELPDIQDEAIARLPWICQSGAFGSIDLEQVVIREDKSTSTNPTYKRIIFHYEQSLLSQLSAKQLSFVLVHEWLWSISKNVAQNRKVNYFLHSDLFDQLPPAEAVRQMQELGVSVQ